MEKIDFYRHHLGADEAQAVADVLDSVFLTTGPRTKKLEDTLAELLRVDHAVGVSSCTAALFLSLKALGIGPGDEVVTTPMTFIATANTVLHCGAKPVFVDVEPTTGNLDAALVEAAITERTKAILPVHLYGQMADMRALRSLADRHRLSLIKDAAHSVEASRDGVRPGQLSDAACFSFYATKNLAAGEGGAVVAKDQKLAERIAMLRNHGMSKNAFQRHTGSYQHWDMLELGYKANMFDLQAAILLAQLDGMEGRLSARRALADRYDARLDSIEGVERPKVLKDSVHSRHLYTIWVDRARRDQILQGFQNAKVGVVVNYRAIHLLSYYRQELGHEEGAFPNAEMIGDRTISLPFYPTMPPEHVDRVCDVLADLVA